MLLFGVRKTFKSVRSRCRHLLKVLLKLLLKASNLDIPGAPKELSRVAGADRKVHYVPATGLASRPCVHPNITL